MLYDEPLGYEFSSNAHLLAQLQFHSEEYMYRFLERFHEKYGNDFLMNELDMTLEQIHAVRDALVVKIPVPRAAL